MKSPVRSAPFDDYGTTLCVSSEKARADPSVESASCRIIPNGEISCFDGYARGFLPPNDGLCGEYRFQTLIVCYIIGSGRRDEIRF